MAEPRQIRFLASVRDESEARLALAGGADIIDCKEPLTGALGALPHYVVAGIRRATSAFVPVSATVGDLPCAPEPLCAEAKMMAATGVDYVKVGLFANGDARSAIAALGACDLGSARLVAVLFADAPLELSVLDDLADAGFAGAMVDTAGKTSGTLTDHLSIETLTAFVHTGKARNLLTGLAGSLGLEHIPMLRVARPDIMGFRGALCVGSNRGGTLDANAIRAIARALPESERISHEALAS